MEHTVPAAAPRPSLAATLIRWMSRGVSAAILLREAARTSRRWQTYFARTAFSGVLLGGMLLGIWAAVGASAMLDAANLGWLGRGLFIGFALTQIVLAVLIAPLTAATAVIEETEERTMDLLVLTSLSPGQILGAKLLSRILMLVTMVFGALPVMALVVNLGGVSVTEVVAVTVHTLTTVVLMASLGGFFALFTRSPALAMLASALYCLPFFVALPGLYVLFTAHPPDAARFSTFAAAFAVDPSAWITPLSWLPSEIVIFAIAVPVFRLRVANADFRHAFSEEIWRTGRWATAVAVFVGVFVLTSVPGAMVLWWQSIGGITSVWSIPIRSLAEIWVWLLFSVGGALLTWAYLRVGMDVVDGIDSVFSNQPLVPVTERGSATVGASPVIWREARPRAWVSTSAPLLVAWALVMLAVFQTGVWIIPGGLLGIGFVNAVGGMVFSVWLATRSIAEERRRNTLECLLTTTLRPRAIVGGKLLGVLLPTAPLVLVSLPLVVTGLPHLHLVDVGSGSYDGFGWLLRGFLTWVWLVPVWALASVLAMVGATRLANPDTAFGAVAGGLGLFYGTAAVLGHAFPAVAWVAVPARIVAPPLAGSFEIWQVVLSTGFTAGIAGAALLWYVDRLRAWVGMAAVLLAVLLAAAAPARAADPPDPAELQQIERANGIRMTAQPLAGGIVREDRTSALHVRIENAGRSTTGTLSLSVDRNDGDTVVYERERVELPEGAVRDVVVLFGAGGGGEWRTLELHTRDGRLALAPFKVRTVDAQAVTVGVVGKDPLGLQATLVDATTLSVPGRQPRKFADGVRQVHVGLCDPEGLPRHAAGYGALDWLVWPAADPSALSAGEIAALRDWVADGGHLLLAVSDSWRQVADSDLGPLLPVQLTGVRDGDVSDLAQALALGTRGSAPFATSAPREGVSPLIRALTPEGDPLWVSAEYGLGSLHLVLTDIRGAPIQLRGHEGAWRRLLSIAGPADAPADMVGGGATVLDRVGRMLNLTAVSAWNETGTMAGGLEPEASWEARIRARLSKIPGVAPLPMTWLVAFAAVYLLAIGPADFWVLRALRRQPWTWVTFPALIVAFTAVSLGLTSYTKGSQAMVVRVEVVDDLPGTGLQRGSTWLGVFSTRKTSLSLTSGREDGVVGRPTVAGYQKNPSIEAGDAPGSLRWDAETWTLSYARSDWVAPAEGGLEVTREGADWVVRNNYDFALDRVGLAIPSEDRWEVAGWVDLGGPLAAGGTLALPAAPDGRPMTSVDGEDPLTWAARTFSADYPSGRGSLRTEADPMILAVAARSFEPLILEGLTPVEQPLLVVRHLIHGGPDFDVDFDTDAVVVELDPALSTSSGVVTCGERMIYPTETGARRRFDGVPATGCTLTLTAGSSYPVAGGERWMCLPDPTDSARCTRTRP